MGTSITLRGRSSRPLSLDELEGWLRGRGGKLEPTTERGIDDDGRPLVAVRIHPAAEPFRVIDLGDRAIRAEAMTGTAGPGYHAHVCALLASRPDVTWEEIEDESDYFEARDRRALENATLLWLRTMAMEILALDARGYHDLQLSLPEGTTFEHDGLVATPMGPRDHAWLERAAKDPRSAIDVFPWWEEGETATVLRNAAISAMWIDVRWRAPLTDAERRSLLAVIQHLERGHALDPEVAWPWREWSELHELLGEQSLAATRVHLRAQSAPPSAIGYRRRPVRVMLSGGWSIEVPGELAERWDERGALAGWDATRSIWFTSLEARGPRIDSETTLAGLPALEGEGELLGLDRGELRAVARVSAIEEDGRQLTMVQAHAALGAHAAIGTFLLHREGDRDWALESWATLEHVSEESPRAARSTEPPS
jgi:hypothetical protein